MRYVLILAALLWTTAASATHLIQPNIIVIMTDDQSVSMMSAMPRTRALIGDAGVTFTKSFVENSLCCPSRATFLTGRYVHNHGVLSNVAAYSGGWGAFKGRAEKQTLAVWLRAAGYRTMLTGKYFNFYEDTTFVPPGWSQWFGALGGIQGAFHNQWNYDLNVNGVIRHRGTTAADFLTDLQLRQSLNFMQQPGKFFLFFSAVVPHRPMVAATRHLGMFPDVVAPRTPDFNEPDISDKPAFLQVPKLSSDAIAINDVAYRKSLRSLLAVDEAVGAIVDALRDAGKLGNTYIIFTSDHGQHFGEHRMKQGKEMPYESDIAVPLLIRGPGVEPGLVDSEHLIVNVDLAATILDMANVDPPLDLDGRSFQPLTAGEAVEWRHAFPISHYGPLPYRGVRTADWKWIEWVDGSRELYDMAADPHEVDNLAGIMPEFEVELAALTARLAECSGETCIE